MTVKSRRKGARAELALVHLLQENGLAAEKVSGMYKRGPDVTVPLLGVDRAVESKIRKRAFGRLYKWLEDRDLLVVRDDHKPLLVIIPIRLALEIAKAAERAPR
jgi:Holliday junction resolvase